MSIFCSLERMVQALSGKFTMHQDTYERWDPRTRIWREVLSLFCPNLKFIILVYVLHFFLNLNYDYWINHKNGNFLNCDWFKKLLFSANLLAKLSDSLLLDNSISQSHSQLYLKSTNQNLGSNHHENNVKIYFVTFLMQISPFFHNLPILLFSEIVIFIINW